MTYLGVVFAVLLGLAFGSFLNVCISRLPLHQSVVSPRSRCAACAHPIAPGDNVPVVSWLRLRGRCRHCGASIAVRYLLVEVLTAAFFVACFLLFGPTLEGLGAAVLCWLLLGLCATDAERLLLPDALTIPGLVLAIVYRATTSALSADRSALDIALSGMHAASWAAAGALLMLLIRWTYALLRRRSGLGLGDVKLFAMIAAWLGVREAALVFFLGVVAGAVYGLIRTATHGAQKKKEPVKVPFGSFLCAGALYAVFLGHATLGWYLSLFR